MVGLAGAGDVEGGAVVHAGAEERQADGDVDAGVEAHELYGDVALVVVLDDDHVEVPLPGAHHNRVRRPRAAGVHPFLQGCLYGGPYLLQVLLPEEAVLPGVRVEAGHGHAGPLDAELLEGLVGEAYDGQLALRLRPVYGFSKGDVGADVDHLQLVGDEHHGVVLRAGQVGQDLGVPGVAVAGEVHGLLVEGGCRYRGDAAGAREPRRPLEVAESRVAGPRVELPEGQVERQLPDLQDVRGSRFEDGVFGLGDLVDP